MNRRGLVLFVELMFFLAATSVVQAGPANGGGWALIGKLGGFTVADPSTNPPTPIQNVDVSLNGARAGTIQNPGDPFAASYSLGITNDPDRHLRDKVEAVFFHTGPTGDFPVSSFFDVFTDITDPGTGQPVQMQQGTVKFFNEKKGFGFVTRTQPSGSADQLLSFTGEINPAQPGLSFGDVLTVQPSPLDPNANSFFDIFTELNFDGSGTINPSLPLFTITMTAPVPEPSGFVLAVFGFIGLLAWGGRRSQNRCRMLPSHEPQSTRLSRRNATVTRLLWTSISGNRRRIGDSMPFFASGSPDFGA